MWMEDDEERKRKGRRHVLFEVVGKHLRTGLIVKS